MPLDEWTAGGSTTTIGGHSIFYRADGGGTPVTLLHGFPTSSHDWAPIVPALVGAGFRVLTLDFLGLGASDKPRDHRYRVTEQADVVEHLWRELAIERTALVAHDYGVSVAQELLARDAARVTSMTWLNGGVYPDLHRPILVQRLLHSRLGPLMSRFSSERTFRMAMSAIMSRDVGEHDLHEMWRSVAHNGGTRVQHQVLRYIDDRRSNAERWRTAMETYSGPTQFIWGPHDPISGGHVLPRLRERLPAADFTVLDVGHYPQIEDPQAVASALLQFLGHG